MVFEDEQKIAELISRIQVYVAPRRIRMKEFYVNFDPLRSGRCTRVQFGRGLDTAGVRTSDAEVELLADHFTENGPKVQKPQVVNYDIFCRLIDEIFAADLSLANTRDGFSPDASMMQMSQTCFVPRPTEDEDRMAHLMHRLAALCKSRGIVFKYQFVDFDRGPSPSPSNVNPRRAGKVTASQFKRLFPFKKEMSDADVEIIMARYTTDSGDIHFQAIHNDISEVLSPEPPPFPTSDLILMPDASRWDHMSLNPVKKIQCKVVEKRVRLGEYFQDFDALRKGFCTAGQLKTVLTINNLEKEVDRNDFNHLVEAYTRDDGMFCYALFCRDVDAAFVMPGLEKDPLATTTLPDSTTTAPARRNRQTLNGSQRQKVNNLEDRLRCVIRNRRVLMTPMFRDMDKARKGVVSRNQFGRVMGMLGLELEQSDIALLCGIYCDRGNHNDFNYIDFIKACDPPIEEQEVAMQQLNAPYQDQAPSKYFDGMRVIPSTGPNFLA